MEVGSSPRAVSSKKCIKYRRSEWSVNEFEVRSGGAVCRVAALHMQGSTLVWLGAAGEQPRLQEAALAVPGTGAPGAVAQRCAVATSLIGDEGSATPLARRLAALLSYPVFVFCGTTFDRFSLPLVESALVTQLKSKST